MSANRQKLQDAKAQFSELVRRARMDEPQEVTVHGKRVIIADAERYEVRPKETGYEIRPRELADHGAIHRGIEKIPRSVQAPSADQNARAESSRRASSYTIRGQVIPTRWKPHEVVTGRRCS